VCEREGKSLSVVVRVFEKGEKEREKEMANDKN